jgi:class 3 adenylate cyclase
VHGWIALRRRMTLEQLIDMAVAVALTAAIAASIRITHQPEAEVRPHAFAFTLGSAIGVMALFRRRAPLLVLFGSAAALQIYYFSDYPGIWPALPLSAALATAIARGHRAAALGVAIWYSIVPVLWLTLSDDRALVAVLRDSLPDGALMVSVLLLGETIRSRGELDRQHRALLAERERSEQLLLNILPASIASRLKESRGPIADRYPYVSVLFADIVGFTRRSAGLPAETIVASLNDLVSDFDALVRERGLEKIKTIGDGYMVAGGIPEPRDDHLATVADMALAMLDTVSKRRAPDGGPLEIRIGIDAGPVVAGVIGTDKFAWDIWGDTVNTASRMESTGVPGRIQTTDRVYELLRDGYRFERRGLVSVKGKGRLCTYFLAGRAVDPVASSRVASDTHAGRLPR